MVAAAFFFSVMSVLVKLAGRRLPTQEVVLARGVVTLAMSWWALRRAGLSPWGNDKRRLVVRGVAGFGALSCYYYAVMHLPLADAVVLHFTNPVMTVLLAAAVLGERVRLRELGFILLGLAGVVLVAEPALLFGTAAGRLAPLGVAAAIGGALFSAVAYVTVRRLAATDHPLVVVFYFPLVAVPATLPMLALGAVWPTPLEWLLLAGVGVSTQIAQVYMTRGLQLERTGRATAVNNLQVVLAYLWGMLLFAERPSALGMAGAALVVGATAAIALRHDAPPGEARAEAAVASVRRSSAS
jgi:drug/metabolite transporter (DMT)-like permease